MAYIPLAQFGTAEDVQDKKGLGFWYKPADVASFKKVLGEHSEEFDSFYLVHDEKGHLREAYGMHGTTPYLTSKVFRLL